MHSDDLATKSLPEIKSRPSTSMSIKKTPRERCDVNQHNELLLGITDQQPILFS